MSTKATNGVHIGIEQYLYALRACAGVLGKTGGSASQGAANAALGLLEDLRQAGWLKSAGGEEAYLFAMEACVSAGDAWSALALLESAELEGMCRSVALRTAAMQVCQTGRQAGVHGREVA